jgi:hypothetical protein
MLSSIFAWTEFAPPRRIAIRSLTTRLNVPVVRSRFGHKSERSHKLDHHGLFLVGFDPWEKAEWWRHPALLKPETAFASRPGCAAMAACQLPVGRHQVSNESLILAQNQRWRRA